jgi:hypothetical protein
MNIEYFDKFLYYEGKGIKKKARECVENFINSFKNYTEKELWALEYLPKLNKNSNGRIRNEIFEEIIFPVLLNGYINKNISLMMWLVELNQNYYQNNRVWEKIDYKTKFEIMKECYELDPNNCEVVDLYLELKIEGINFGTHEWPFGILFGNNFATEDECRILLEEVAFINRLDRNKKYSEYISDYENKIREYMGRTK